MLFLYFFHNLLLLSPYYHSQQRKPFLILEYLQFFQQDLLFFRIRDYALDLVHILLHLFHIF